MAFDGKAVWRQAIYENFRFFLEYLKGKDDLWITRRIKHLEAEIERLFNQKNGFFKKLNEVSSWFIKITKTVPSKKLLSGTKSLSSTDRSKFSNPVSKTDPFVGDELLTYRETAYPNSPPVEDAATIDAHAIGDISNNLKFPYIKSIQRYFEKIEFKIRKTQDLIEELYKEKLLLEFRLQKPDGNTSAKTNDSALLQLLTQLGNETGHIVPGRVPSSNNNRLLPRPTSPGGN